MTTDGSETVARRFTSHVHRMETQGCIEPSLPVLAALCKGDFVLRIDDDEALGGDWHAPVAGLSVNGEVTHFFTPRRWIAPGENHFFISDEYSPDLQMRLFRNDPCLITWPWQIHEHTEVSGAGQVLQDRWIEHYALLQTRDEREQKCARYHALRPDKHLSHFYLWEDRAVRMTAINAAAESGTHIVAP